MQKKSPRGGKLPDKTPGIRPQMANLPGGMNRIAALRQLQEFCNRAAARLPPLFGKQPHLLRRLQPRRPKLVPIGRIAEETALRRSCWGHAPGRARIIRFPAPGPGLPARRLRLPARPNERTAAENLLRWSASRRNRTFRTARWTENIRSRKSMSETAWKGPRLGSFSFLLNRGRFSRANTGTGSILKRKRVTMMPSWSLAAPDTMS